MGKLNIKKLLNFFSGEDDEPKMNPILTNKNFKIIKKELVQESFEESTKIAPILEYKAHSKTEKKEITFKDLLIRTSKNHNELLYKAIEGFYNKQIKNEKNLELTLCYMIKNYEKLDKNFLKTKYYSVGFNKEIKNKKVFFLGKDNNSSPIEDILTYVTDEKNFQPSMVLARGTYLDILLLLFDQDKYFGRGIPKTADFLNHKDNIMIKRLNDGDSFQNLIFPGTLLKDKNKSYVNEHFTLEPSEVPKWEYADNFRKRESFLEYIKDFEYEGVGDFKVINKGGNITIKLPTKEKIISIDKVLNTIYGKPRTVSIKTF